uniref:Pentacotripeptide-repeat region of PRORP domain-containing protein n=1 Tax=Peronospora matthiolae TaxID=2874970 RepID=A0AAV1T7C9_9STRA
MFASAHELLLYQQTLWSEICSGTTTTDETLTTGWSEQSKALMPPSVFASAAFDPVRDFQQQGFLELFKASVYTQQSPRNVVHVFSDYVEGTCRAAGGKVERVRTRVLERGFGAAIHCCVKLEECSLASHCYEVMESTRERLVCAGDGLPVDDAIDEGAERVGIVDEVLLADENIYVNVLKACMEIEDFSTFKDAFRGMVARGVARSAGFGSAIRYCHKHLDPVFLEEVLDGTGPSQGAVLANAEQLVDSDRHITMLEMVESHCNASIEEVFHLLDVFLEWKLTSNLQVFTSLLSIYMRRREVGNAVALIGAMEEHGIVQDVKALTTVAFIHASRGD